MNEELKGYFTPDPMLSFRCLRKLTTSLVRAKLYALKRSVGSNKFDRSCYQVCTNVNEKDTFTSTFTGRTYRIHHEFTCVEKCLIFSLHVISATNNTISDKKMEQNGVIQ